MLEINREHKKYNAIHINKPRKRILSSLLGTAVAFSAYSGALDVKTYAFDNNDSITIKSDVEDEVLIPDCYRNDILFYCNKQDGDIITKKDLANLQSLCVWNYSNQKMDFLKYCTSLKSILIKTSESNLSNLAYLKELNNLKSFSVVSTLVPVELNKSNCSFLLNNKKIEEIKLKGHINVEPELLSEMDNLKNMTVCYDEYTYMDYSSLNNLKYLKIDGLPYDIAVSTSYNDILFLRNKGVEVDINNDLLDKLESIEVKLNNIVFSLGIKSTDNDIEKMNKIVLYTLNNLSYDKEMDIKLANGDADALAYSDNFYDGGNLYGALEMDTQICGNYAAFVSALAHRVGIYSYHVMSNSHSWNLVNLNGDYYYVDTTWLDDKMFDVPYNKDGNLFKEKKVATSLIEDGNVQFLDYYMDEPLSYTSSDHKEINFPSYLKDDITKSIKNNVYDKDRSPIKIYSSSDTVVTDSNIAVTSEEMETSINAALAFNDNVLENVTGIYDDVEVGIDGKLFVVPAGALMGILIALGGAKLVKRKKQKSKDNSLEDKPENKFRI